MKKSVALNSLLLASLLGNSFAGIAQGLPPEVKLIVPSSYTETGSDILLKADAKDADGSIMKAEFYRAGTKLGEDLVFPYLYDVKNVQPGTQAFSVKVTDNQGNVTTSAAKVEVTIFVWPTIQRMPRRAYFINTSKLHPDKVTRQQELQQKHQEPPAHLT